MTKTEELLKVLDLPNVEQHKWLRQYAIENKLTEQHVWKWFIIATGNGEIDAVEFTDNMAIAGLAFRLRDEVCHISPAMETNFCKALDRVEAHCNNTDQDNFCWWLLYAQPIHWVVASLIAKEEKP